MADNHYPTPEEMQKLIEKAQRDLQQTLDKMTPEERRQAEIRAQKAIAEDAAAKQKLIDECAAVMAQSAPKAAPKFCSSCGAPVSGGNFCEYCGTRLL